MKNIDTAYGFEWGAASISRCFCDEDKGWVVLSLITPKKIYKRGIQIYVTKTGKVRIYDDRGEWTPPEERK